MNASERPGGRGGIDPWVLILGGCHRDKINIFMSFFIKKIWVKSQKLPRTTLTLITLLHQRTKEKIFICVFIRTRDRFLFLQHEVKLDIQIEIIKVNSSQKQILGGCERKKSKDWLYAKPNLCKKCSLVPLPLVQKQVKFDTPLYRVP